MFTSVSKNLNAVSATLASGRQNEQRAISVLSRIQSCSVSLRLSHIAVYVPLTLSLASALLLPGCAVGPKYNRPTVQTPPAFKELATPSASDGATWKTAQPKDDALRGKWWEIYKDPQLNQLEDKAVLSNQNIAAAAANFLAARALVRQARSQYFPTLTTNPSIVNTRPSPAQLGALPSVASSAASAALQSYTDYSLPFDASWELDLWGRVRNGVRANIFAAQASAADLQSVHLTEQAELAVDYFELRAQDTLKDL